jgi:hypothetical protein
MDQCGPVDANPFPTFGGTDSGNTLNRAVGAVDHAVDHVVDQIAGAVDAVDHVVDQIVDAVDDAADQVVDAADQVVDRLRGMRWPSPATIRAAAAALASGETLALAGRRLQYVSQFFGLSLLPRPADVTPRQWAARQNWIRRRTIFGANGFSAKGEHALRLNLVQAAIVKQRAPKSTHCRRGHRWTTENTRVTAKGRSCRTCERLVRAERVRRKLAARKAVTVLADVREQMIAVGIRSHQDPTSAYWRQRYVALRSRWRALKRELAPYV